MLGSCPQGPEHLPARLPLHGVPQERYHLDRAKPFFEVPLDSISARRIRALDEDVLPRWRGVKALDYRTSKRYQDAAARIAASKGILPVHLDAIWWGLRESDDAGD